jgi:hypothetical protein
MKKYFWLVAFQYSIYFTDSKNTFFIKGQESGPDSEETFDFICKVIKSFFEKIKESKSPAPKDIGLVFAICIDGYEEDKERSKKLSDYIKKQRIDEM